MTNPTPTPPDTSADGFILPPKWYDRVRMLVQFIVPALSTLYFTMGAIWGLPAVEQVVGSLAALVTFGGVLLTMSRKNFQASDARFDGKVNIIDQPTGVRTYQLELNDHPDNIEFKKELLFKVPDVQQK